jgi:hypothetical protein
MKEVKRNIQQLWRQAVAIRVLYGAVICSLAASLLTSCILHEDVISREATAGEPFVSIELRLPGDPYSYAVTDPDENLIRTLDVLVFREGEDGKEYYLRHVVVNPSTITNGDPLGRTKTCTVEIPASDNYKQRLVFIANAHGSISAATAAGSLLKENLLSRIVFNMEEGNWPAENSVTFVPFPMWGESELLTLSEDVTSLSERIYMLRMVARVDIKVDDALQDYFELHEVYLYNRYERGRVVPGSDAVDDAGAAIMVNAPTVPAGVLPVTEPIANNFYATDDDNLWSVTQSIYLMENAATDKPKEATCFVVGGKYRDSEEIRYWRVDLPLQNGGSFSDGFRTFLRNNWYNVLITAVNSEGCEDPGDAFHYSWAEVVVDVTQWNLVDVVIDDRETFTLKASPASFNYLRAGTEDVSGRFSINTDYWKSDADQGWTGEWQYSDNDGSWLHIAPQVFHGDKNVTTNYTFTVDENLTGEDRHAALKVTAGNMVKYIDIYQTNQVFSGGGGNVYDWTESGQSGNTTNGAYRLGVSVTRIDIEKTESSTGSFLITTDYPVGYTTRVIYTKGGSDWLAIQSGGLASGAVIDQTLTFTVSDNLSIEPREAIIEVRAGNLEKRVRVVQNEYMNGDIFVGMEWVESGQSGNTTGGPYRLGVGRTRFDFPKNIQSEVILAVATNDPGGYSAKVTKGGDWITITGNASSTTAWPDPVSLKFSVEENNGIAPRVGELCITAGNLKKYITVSQDIIANVSPGGNIIDWKEDEREEPLDGAYNLTLSRQNIVCTGEEITISMAATATASAGVRWTATTENDWITNLTSSGAADGTAQPLSFTLAANGTEEKRNGVITVSVIHRGNKLTQDIHVWQYPASDPVIRAVVDPVYVTDQLLRQSFRLYSKMDWAVRLKSGGNPSGILRTLYTTGGVANGDGDNIWFALNTLSAATPVSHTVTLEIYSPTGEFNTMEVEIQGVTPISLSNILIYPEDQPEDYSWYVYANVADDTNNMTEQGPGTEEQVDPPRTGSCAALPANGGNPWRLPTHDELKAIAATVESNPADYNFTNSAFYWSATSSVHDGAYLVRVTSPGGDNGGNKTINNHKARCVRDK